MRGATPVASSSGHVCSGAITVGSRVAGGDRLRSERWIQRHRSERPNLADPRRPGDEIHPWLPNGDLRPAAAVWSHRLRPAAPEHKPVLRSGRPKAVEMLCDEH